MATEGSIPRGSLKEPLLPAKSLDQESQSAGVVPQLLGMNFGKIGPKVPVELLNFAGDHKTVETRKKHFSSDNVQEYQLSFFYLIDWSITWIRYQSISDKLQHTDNDAGGIAKFISSTPHNWLGIVSTVILGAMGAVHMWWTYRSQERSRWNSDPANFAQYLFNEEDLASPENYLKRIDELNQQLLAMLERSEGLRAKYTRMEFTLHNDELCFVCERNPSFEGPSEEPKKSRWLAFGSWLKQFLSWPGLWFWLIFMNTGLFTGDFNNLLNLSFQQSSMVFAAVFIPSLIYTAYKLINFWKHRIPNPRHLAAGEQKDLVTLFRRFINQKKYQEANKQVKWENSFGKADPNKIQMALALDSPTPIKRKNLLPHMAKEPESKQQDLVLRRRVEQLKLNQNKKLLVATLSGFALAYALQTYFMVTLQNYVNSSGKEIPKEVLWAIGVLMLLIALQQARDTFLEKREELAKTETKAKKALKSDDPHSAMAKFSLLSLMEEKFQKLQILQSKAGLLLTEITVLKKRVFPKDSKLLPFPEVVDFFDPIAFQDVRRTAPHRFRGGKKFLKRLLIATAAMQSVILGCRIALVSGTGYLPFIDTIPMIGVSGSWTYADACYLTAVLAAVLWGSIKLWEYVHTQEDARTELFLDQMAERAEVLDWQLEHYASRVLNLHKQLDDLKLSLGDRETPGSESGGIRDSKTKGLKIETSGRVPADDALARATTATPIVSGEYESDSSEEISQASTLTDVPQLKSQSFPYVPDLKSKFSSQSFNYNLVSERPSSVMPVTPFGETEERTEELSENAGNGI